MDIRMEGNKILFQNGQMFVTQSRQDSVRQRLQIRLRTVRGTWFLNINYAIDWFNDVFADGVSKVTVDALLQSEILKEPLVQRITAFVSSVDSITGIYSCDFSVKMVGLEKAVVVRLLTNESGMLVVNENSFGIRVD